MEDKPAASALVYRIVKFTYTYVQRRHFYYAFLWSRQGVCRNAHEGKRVNFVYVTEEFFFFLFDVEESGPNTKLLCCWCFFLVARNGVVIFILYKSFPCKCKLSSSCGYGRVQAVEKSQTSISGVFQWCHLSLVEVFHYQWNYTLSLIVHIRHLHDMWVDCIVVKKVASVPLLSLLK